MLYLPRGTIHQAAAQSADSAHVTVSTYQGFSWGDVAQALLLTALAAQQPPGCLPLALRHSPPAGFLASAGYGAALAGGIQTRWS